MNFRTWSGREFLGRRGLIRLPKEVYGFVSVNSVQQRQAIWEAGTPVLKFPLHRAVALKHKPPCSCVYKNAPLQASFERHGPESARRPYFLRQGRGAQSLAAVQHLQCDPFPHAY